MKAPINNKLINSIVSGDKPIEIRDTELKKHVLRIQPSGKKTFYLEYARGKRIRLGCVPEVTPALARELAIQWLAKIAKGEDPEREKKKERQHTFGSFIDERYAPWVEANIKTPKATLQRLRKRFSDFLDFKLNEFTPWLIEKWRHARIKAGIKQSTINRDLADLKSCLQKAVNWDLLEVHPLSKVKKGKIDNKGKVRYLTRKEERQLREALDVREFTIRRERQSANAWRTVRRYKLLDDFKNKAYVDHLKPLVLLSLNTGMRRGELFSLEWEDIDLDKAILTVVGERAKSGKTRHIPLNQEALDILKCWKDQSICLKGLVFPGQDGNPLDNVKKGWQSLLKAANITKFRWHDLRHTFASNLSMADVDLNTIRELLGHSDYTMTLRYAHLAPEHKAEAVAKLIKNVNDTAIKAI